MFYSQFILAKKGPLGTIWIAAHLERKLRKNQVADTDIGVSVDSILSPEVPIALRLSSHLLLGVVRIYSKKVTYLFDDCSEALLKVKQAFRSAAVDLPPEESKAPYHSITLPETFDLDDFELPDNELFQGNFVDHHVSTKEQITLQDTMDGVVYSTSQFGLDERFGDGDASQIGLDLDEELLLNKGTSSGHGVLLTSCVNPKTSFEPPSTEKGDGLDEEMHERHEASEAIATNCSIEAPSTPGLVEGPNLPSAEEALIGDDCMEEDHDPTEFAPGDKGGSASTHGTDQAALQDNDCALGNEKIEKSRSHAGSPSTAEPMELIDSSTITCASDSNQVLKASEGLDVECAQDGAFHKSDLNGVKSGEFGEAQDTGLNETTVSLNACCMSPALISQPDHFHDKSSANGLCSESECTSFADKSSLEPVIEAEEGLHSYSEKEGGLDFTRPEASEISNAGAGADTISGSKPILQPCNLRSSEENTDLNNVLSVPNLPYKDFGVGSEGKDAPGVCVVEEQDVTGLNLNLNEDQLLDAAPCNELDGQPFISENVELPEGNDSELPSPEKMLSLPDVPVSQSDGLFVGSTPEREVLMQGDQDATMNDISAKKRSFAESTMTLQSLKSVESSEATQSKRTVGFVPKDDDLLSSILVGRRSTVLKVKSTPPTFDLPSSKRPRCTPRSGAHKRKVLVDDSMVLHGDTIRQQLVTTEDIRRVRKKAPSTHPEIWILQKQFLEDEIFHEPIFTGMSAELVSLHCQPFDVRQTKLLQDEENKTQSSAPDMTGSPVKSIVGEDTEFEGPSIPVARDESAQQPAECISIHSDIRESSDVGGNALENEGITGGEVGHMPSIAKDESAQRPAECISLQSNIRESSDVGDNAPENERMTSDEARHTPSLLGISDNRIEMETEMECSREPDPISDDVVPITNPLPDCSLPVIDENIVTEDRVSNDGRMNEHETIDKAEFPESDLNYNDRELPLDHQRENLEIESSNPVGDEDGTVNKDEFPESDLKYDDTNPHLDYQKEDLEIHSSNPVGGELGTGNVVFFEEMNPENQFAESQMFMDANATASDRPTHGNLSDLEADVFEHDTDFLNFDDDEIAQEDENGVPNAEGPQILDNSGWSTRTRAVANYLQVLFQKEAQHGRTGLHLDNLVANKTRKEASRMFFETLVLKTRDYIHVEQPVAFGNVSIKPRARLLKSDF